MSPHDEAGPATGSSVPAAPAVVAAVASPPPSAPTPPCLVASARPRHPSRAVPWILSTTLVLGSVMTVGFVGSSITHRESWSVQYAAPETPAAGAAFGVLPAAYEPPREDVQLERVVAAVDRSDEYIATEAQVPDGVLQARSELGMLLATYQAQQAAAGGAAPGTSSGTGTSGTGSFFLDGLATPPAPAPLSPLAPVVPVEPAAPGTSGVIEGPAPTQAPSDVLDAAAAANTVSSGVPAGYVPAGAADALATDPVPVSPEPTAPVAPDAQGGDAPSGVVAPDGTVAPEGTVAPDGVVAPDGTVEDGAPLPGDLTGDPTDEDAPDHDDLVTLDDVVVAATRLAELMGPSYALAPGDVLPAAGMAVPAGGTLADQLAAVVAKYADSTAQYGNGQLPGSVLCGLDFAPGHSLRCDAAEQLNALAVEYQKEFGKPLRITDSYRSYDAQVAVKAAKPYLAAVPGTSQHGWGLAIDVGQPVSTGRSAEYLWMRLHAPDYGWDNPSWARLDGRKPEPWHFEFYAAGAMPDRYTGGAPATPSTPPVTPTTPPSPSPTTPPSPSPTPTPTPTTPAPTDPPTPTTPPTTPTKPPPTTPPTDPPTTTPPTETPDPTDPPTTTPPTTAPPTETPTAPPTSTPDPTTPPAPTSDPTSTAFVTQEPTGTP